jgi:aryl-alcohol dehydrogenase-like predicted oxidoreductase
MKDIPRMNVSTSRLGFGCVQLTAHRNRKEAVSALEHAFCMGITHFDVARAYGFGRAEGILREFLVKKRAKVTLTTKFGMEPPSGLAGNARLINGLKKTLRHFPGVLRRAKNYGSAMTKSGLFTPESAVRSLEVSLRELGTDYVDIFLLHEATLADANSEQLVEALVAQVEKGKIRQLGLGSAFPKIEACGELLPDVYKVLQFNDNAADRSVQKLPLHNTRFMITHSVFNPLKSLQRAVRAFPEIAREHSTRVNIDLTEPATMSSFLLQFALWNNPDGMVLFSSKDPLHISTNVRDAASLPSEETMRYFIEFVNQILLPTNPGRSSYTSFSESS